MIHSISTSFVHEWQIRISQGDKELRLASSHCSTSYNVCHSQFLTNVYIQRSHMYGNLLVCIQICIHDFTRNTGKNSFLRNVCIISDHYTSLNYTAISTSTIYVHHHRGHKCTIVHNKRLVECCYDNNRKQPHLCMQVKCKQCGFRRLIFTPYQAHD